MDWKGCWIQRRDTRSGRLVTLTSAMMVRTRLVSQTEQLESAEFGEPGNYIIYHLEKRQPLLCIDLCIVLDVRACSKWLIVFISFKSQSCETRSSDVGSKGRPTVATCQCNAAGPGSITSLDYWNSLLALEERDWEQSQVIGSHRHVKETADSSQ